MLIKGEIIENINLKIDKLLNFIDKKCIDNNVAYTVKKIGSFFRKNVLKDTSYTSDIDIGIYFKINNDNKNDVYDVIRESISYCCKNNNFYFNHIKCGLDDRFNFDIEVDISGNIQKYEPKKIKESILKMYNFKYITKKEYDNINLHIKDNPTFEEIYSLVLILKKFKNIFWTCDEINKNEKIYRKKKIKYSNLIDKFRTLYNCVFEFEKGKYINFDINFITYSVLPECEKFIDKINNDFIYKECGIVNDGGFKKFLNYHDIFKFYMRKKYFKVLKRLKNLLISYLVEVIIIRENGTNLPTRLRRRDTVKKHLNITIKKIEKISRKKILRCLDQLSNRIEIIIILLEYKSENEIKRLIVDLLKDSINFCKHDILKSVENKDKNIINTYNVLKNKYDKEKIKETLEKYKKSVDSKLNNIALPELIKIYEKIYYLLPFKLNLLV